MAKKTYRKDYLTKITGSQYWYFQIRIKEEYRDLPFFKNNPKWAKRDKILESLKTPNYDEAVIKVQRRLLDIGIKQISPPPELKTGSEGFFSVLRDSKSRSSDELNRLLDTYESLRDDALSPAVAQRDALDVMDEVSFDHYSKAVEAVQRELKERDAPFYSQPYPYEITLLQLAEYYRTEIVEDGADNKTQSKLHHAARKLLEFRGVSDIEVRLIKPKLVNDYVRYSKKNNVAEGTMRSELAALSNVWKYGVRNEYLQEGINPFANVQLKGFKSKTTRKPFTPEMVTELLKASKSDADMEQLIMCSYYTGMRLSEVFAAKLRVEGDVLCFDVASEGGKTEAAKRLIPIHDDLRSWLEKKYEIGQANGLLWSRPTHDSVGKKFGRLKNVVLGQVGITDLEQKKEYVHHSFRHGFVTMLIEAGFHELEFADLTGHSKAFLGRTEAGRTYTSTARMNKLQSMVNVIPVLGD